MRTAKSRPDSYPQLPISFEVAKGAFSGVDSTKGFDKPPRETAACIHVKLFLPWFQNEWIKRYYETS